MSRFLVTGASGFIGRHLVRELRARGHDVREVLRHTKAGACDNREVLLVEDIGPDTDWGDGLGNVDVVVHLAARAHVMKEHAKDPLLTFRGVNVEGTVRLAQAAAASGVKRFVFTSTVGVLGRCADGRAFTEADVPAPHDPYSVSKWEAEQALWNLAARTGLDLVVLRLPLVYGPNNPGNFLRLLTLVDQGWPLPLGSVVNRRSLLFVNNLADALIQCALHPSSARQTYLLSDGEDVSTPELMKRLALSMGRPVHLFSCPTPLLRLAGKFTGQADNVARLLDSLVVDSAKIRQQLGWSPPVSLDQGLRETVQWFLRQRSMSEANG